MRRSLKELVALEDFLAVWYLLLHIDSWVRHSWKKSMGRQQQQHPAFSKHGCCCAFLDSVENCSSDNRADQTVLSDLNGTLLRSTNSFAYFFLLAFEAGKDGMLRAFLLLLMYPFIWFAANFVSQSSAMQMLIFISFCGVKESAAMSVAHAVLPKFFLEDMHPHSYRVFVACGKRYVVTSNPRLLVEPFLKEFLGVEHVLGTELQVTKGGYCTGFVKSSGVLVGANMERALKEYFRDRSPSIGLGQKRADCSFLFLCKEAYIVPSNKKVPPVPREHYLKPLIFHDGRFAIRPTPAAALAVFLWLPFGLMLAFPRLLVAVATPSVPLAGFLEALLGLQIRVKGETPSPAKVKGHGVLFVCTHRMLVDPIFLSVCVNRRVTAVTYSISRISELLAPIKTMRLTRCRAQDARAMKSLLDQGDLAVCPEGTTCREPYLLRFSSLFAELTDIIVPVAVTVKFQFFHGSTARGWKAFDPLFFLLNPFPMYHIELLEQVPAAMTCAAGKTSFEVANYVQKRLADALGFECTNYTRKDKYRMLAGNDGVVKETSVQPKRLLQW